MNIHSNAANASRQRSGKGIPRHRHKSLPGSYICPKCTGGMIVLDSRPTENSVRRVRCCTNCGLRITTKEITASGGIEATDAIQQFISDLRELADKYQLTLDRLEKRG